MVLSLKEYLELPWEDVLYKQAGKDAPIPYDRSAWTDVKETLGLPFPNLPYLIDGDLKLTQSMAILRHVARKRPELNLQGWDDVSMAHCDMVLSEFSDAKSRITSLMYRQGQEGPEYEQLMATDLPHQLQLFEAFLGDKPWFVGDRITLADFAMFEYLDCAVLFSGNPVLLTGAFPRLASFKSRFEMLPAIAAYLASPKFAEVKALNNQTAKFR